MQCKDSVVLFCFRKEDNEFRFRYWDIFPSFNSIIVLIVLSVQRLEEALRSVSIFCIRFKNRERNIFSQRNAFLIDSGTLTARGGWGLAIRFPGFFRTKPHRQPSSAPGGIGRQRAPNPLPSDSVPATGVRSGGAECRLV